MYTYEDPKRSPKAYKNVKCKEASALVSSAVSLGRDFCMETSMHGFRHVAEPKRHWAERILWAAATAMAIWGAVHVSLGQLQRYNENPTVVTLEKDFRSWQFSLPAVTACPKNRTDLSKLEKVILDTWNVAPFDDRYGYYVKFVRTVSESTLSELKTYEEFADDPSLDVDLYQLAVDFLSTQEGILFVNVVSSLVVRCTRGVVASHAGTKLTQANLAYVDIAKPSAVLPSVEIKTTVENANMQIKWIPIMTEFGACYSINSLAVEDIAITKPHPNDTILYPLTCKYGGTSSCHVKLDVTSFFNFFFHSPYDIVDITTPSMEVSPGYLFSLDLSVTETMCGKGIKDLRPQRRGCLFNDEPMGKRKVYSTNACRQTCRSKLALQLCKCIPFYYFYDGGPYCTPSGMACLAHHTQNLTSIGGTKCACGTQCLYSVFRDIAKHDQVFWDRGPWSEQGSIKYVVLPPKIRYTREIVFHFQDLVVSFGGAAGLFLGASFISFVEIIYFLLERMLKAVSVEETRPKTNDDLKKKLTYEEQRVMDLTAMLDQGHKHQASHRNILHF